MNGPDRAKANSSSTPRIKLAAISSGNTRWHKASDCANAVRITVWVLSNMSRVERLAFRRNERQLRYRAYANTKEEAEQSMVWKETVSQSDGWRSLIPSRLR
jgi:hypothetical protein